VCQVCQLCHYFGYQALYKYFLRFFVKMGGFMSINGLKILRHGLIPFFMAQMAHPYIENHIINKKRKIEITRELGVPKSVPVCAKCAIIYNIIIQ